MSPKNSSLAIEESIFEEQFEPQLNLIINGRKGNLELIADLAAEVVNITGRVTVSF